jgi:hypothetical protein
VSTSSSTSPTRSPTPSPRNSNTGAIVGGVVGGVAAISIAVAVSFFYLRRRRSRAPSAAAPGVGASQPPVDEIKHGTSGAPMRLYVRAFIPNPPPRSCMCSSHVLSCVFFFDTQDPNDPTTFPVYQGALQSLATAQGPVPSHTVTGSTPANMQTSQPQGYQGIPVPTV